jgi:hypothetical protein
MTNLSWFAAPILAQRNIELHSIDVTFEEETRSTVYTVHEATGKIGVFKIPAMELAKAVEHNTHGDLLGPLFESLEFTDGKSPVPEVQQVSAGTPEGAGKPESTEATVDTDGATSTPASPTGDAETASKPKRGRRKPRQTTTPVDGGGIKPDKESIDKAGESVDGVDGAVEQPEQAPSETGDIVAG